MTNNAAVEPTMRKLLIPPKVKTDAKATEMIRVWLAHGDVHVSLLLDMWQGADEDDFDERFIWGYLLADVARHIANGMKKSHGWPKTKTLARIKQAFLQNLKSKARKVEGDFLEAKQNK